MVSPEDMARRIDARRLERGLFVYRCRHVGELDNVWDGQDETLVNSLIAIGRERARKAGYKKFGVTVLDNPELLGGGQIP